VPFTTGFLAKFGVVGASVATHAYVLAVVAMVSAAVAAFFYLRVAVTMYSPVGPIADPVDPDGEPVAGSSTDASTGETPPSAGRPAEGSAVDATDGQVSSLQVLTDAAPDESVTRRGIVPVPALTWVAIGITVAFTVVFGVIPGPILDFAHQATLLFT
jgi:NADH-quinone oxidoreductase subunit N